MPAISQARLHLQLLNIAILNAIVVLGLNFVTGWAGQINFGQAAFYGLGAYTTAIATKSGLPWIATPFLSIVVVIAASLMLGPADHAPAHLLSGHDDYRLWRNHPADHRALGAGHGRHVRLAGDPRHQHLRAGPEGQEQHYYFCSPTLALAITGRSAHSSFGARPRDDRDRDSEIAAEQSGVDTTRTKLLAFMIGAVYAGTRWLPLCLVDPLHQPRQLFRHTGDPADDDADRRRHGLDRGLRLRRGRP